MSLKEKIKNDLKDAMKNGDDIVRGVLRLLSSDILIKYTNSQYVL